MVRHQSQAYIAVGHEAVAGPRGENVHAADDEDTVPKIHVRRSQGRRKDAILTTVAAGAVAMASHDVFPHPETARHKQSMFRILSRSES